MEEIGFQYISKSFENKEFVSRINSIYHHMQDEVSKTIFYNRVMYSMTDEPIFMRNVLLNTEMGRNLNKALESKQSLYIYGAGRRGKRLVDMFPEKNWKGLFDTQKIGEYHGIKIMPVFSKKSNENSVVIISNYVGFETIKDNLKKFGWKDQEIIVMGEYDKEMARNMHFEKDVCRIHSKQEGYFIDAGAYDGEDTIRYSEFIGDDKKVVRAILFEPDKNSYINCRRNLSSFKNVEIRNTILGSGKIKKIGFSGGKGEGSAVDIDATEKLVVDSIDAIVGKKKISMIKMDIEGMELEALKGAKETIKQQAPVLAISVYHKREDIWEIPYLILSINSNYRFYLRHYTVSYGDTVLYAVVK